MYWAKENSVETSYTYYGTPLKPALVKPYLAKAIFTNPAVFPPTRTLAKLEPNKVSPRGTSMRNRIWTEFKNA